MKKLVLSGVVLSSFCLSASAIVWDSKDYNNTKAKNFASNKSHKIGAGGCSANKAKNEWITFAKHCPAQKSFKDGGKTFSVVQNETHSSTDARLAKVRGTLPSGRMMVTSSDIAVNTQFYQLGKGKYGVMGTSYGTGDISHLGATGTWRGGRNEVDSLVNSTKEFRFWWTSSYENEVCTAPGDSGGPAVAGSKQVSTVWGRLKDGTTHYRNCDWTRIEGWWNKFL